MSVTTTDAPRILAQITASYGGTDHTFRLVRINDEAMAVESRDQDFVGDPRWNGHKPRLVPPLHFLASGAEGPILVALMDQAWWPGLDDEGHLAIERERQAKIDSQAQEIAVLKEDLTAKLAAAEAR